MPKEFTIDELIERFVVINKINEGEKYLKEGRTLSDEELDRKIDIWFAWYGPNWRPKNFSQYIIT